MRNPFSIHPSYTTGENPVSYNQKLGKPKWHQVCPHVTKKMPQLNKNYAYMPYMQLNRW